MIDSSYIYTRSIYNCSIKFCEDCICKLLSDITCTTCDQSESSIGVMDNNYINKISSVSPTVASTTVTNIEPKSSESDNHNAIPLIAGVIAGIIVLIGSGIVLVVVLLLMKARYMLDKIEVANPCVTNDY